MSDRIQDYFCLAQTGIISNIHCSSTWPWNGRWTLSMEHFQKVGWKELHFGGGDGGRGARHVSLVAARRTDFAKICLPELPAWIFHSRGFWQRGEERGERTQQTLANAMSVFQLHWQIHDIHGQWCIFLIDNYAAAQGIMGLMHNKGPLVQPEGRRP